MGVLKHVLRGRDWDHRGGGVNRIFVDEQNVYGSSGAFQMDLVLSLTIDNLG